MMVGWAEINAYVDGELDAEHVARMAAAIADDPSLAARVATIARLKAVTVATARPCEALAFPESLVAPEGGRRRPWKPLALAACIALLVLAGSAARLGGPAAVDPIAAAAATEHVWLSGTAPGGTALRSADAVARDDPPPDLSAADLQLGYVAQGSAGQAGAFAGYVGPNGCRLGFWSGPGDGSAYPPTPRDLGAVRIRAWSDGRRTFALMSRSMGAERLDHVTALVADLTRRSAPDEGQRTRLYAAARARTPCLG